MANKRKAGKRVTDEMLAEAALRHIRRMGWPVPESFGEYASRCFAGRVK